MSEPSDPYKYFRVEARELLDQLGKGVMDLERGPAPDLVGRLLRVAHTLKGAARVVKQREIADGAHAIESILAPHRDSPAVVTRELVDGILRHLDAMGRSVAGLVPPPDPSSAAPAAAGIDEIFRTVRADVAEVDGLIAGLTEVHARMAVLRRTVQAAGRAGHLTDLLAGHVAATRSAGPIAAVDSGVGRKVLSLAGELQDVCGPLEQALATGVDQLDRELAQVRDAAERLRLVPAGVLFTFLERAVREAARTLGKRVAFEGRGGEVRLDAHVLAGMQDALLQVVANAVAHGVETEAERRAAGKPPEARILLVVTRRGRRVLFSCRDDGRGVDLEAVRRVAQRRGLSPAEARELGAGDLLRLLLKGGLTTSTAVTEVAGRGIGLDVVREAIERLGGQTSVRTEAGRGTTIELVVPLSLASLDGLLVEANGHTVTVPLEAVRGAVRLRPRDVARSPAGEPVAYDGKVLPFVPLARALPHRAPSPAPAYASSAVIIEGQAGLVAVGVERLVGTAHVVLRALPELAPASAVVAGASLDAEGNPQLVLDPDGLVEAARQGAPTDGEPRALPRPILVVDDSLTTRMLEQSILESAGYDVDVASSGEEALQKARSGRYSLFLVDVEMPGMDGFEFIERAGADPGLRDVPAILVTSRASPEDRRRGEQVGAKAYIVKSEFEQRDLLERISKLVG